MRRDLDSSRRYDESSDPHHGEVRRCCHAGGPAVQHAGPRRPAASPGRGRSLSLKPSAPETGRADGIPWRVTSARPAAPAEHPGRLDRLNARRSSAIHRVWMEQRRARGERMACPPGTGWASRSRPSASRAGQDDHASSSVPRPSPPGGRVLERASASTLERRRLHAGPARDPATPRGRRRCAPPPRAAPAPSRSLIGAWPLGPRRSEWAVARGGSDGAWKRRSRPPVPRHGRPKRA
jgi:hypothetical protein